MSHLVKSWWEVAQSGFFTEGQYVRKLEEEVEKWSGLHAIAVNSAGTGLYAIMRCLSIPFKTVAVPNNTFMATGAMAQEAGYNLRLVDCAADDFSMGLQELRSVINDNPIGGVILTHVGGALARDYLDIANLCASLDIPLIEDAAHVLGVKRPDGTVAGSHGTVAVFSFYPTKAVPAGEGGMIVTDDEHLAEEIRRFRNYGKHKVDGVIRYGPGFNFRMDEWTAAVAYHQMLRLNEILELRHEAALRLAEVVPPLVPYEFGETNWYKYAASSEYPAVKQGGKIYMRSDQLVEALGIEGQGPFPNSEKLAESHICLPLDEKSYEGMHRRQIDHFLRGDDQ
jgi:perosamine synthetase